MTNVPSCFTSIIEGHKNRHVSRLSLLPGRQEDPDRRYNDNGDLMPYTDKQYAEDLAGPKQQACPFLFLYKVRVHGLSVCSTNLIQHYNRQQLCAGSGEGQYAAITPMDMPQWVR
jgi:hypothetical protein